MLYGFFQEEIVTQEFGPKKEKFKYTLSLIFIQCIVNAICAYAMLWYQKDNSKVPITEYFFTSATYISAMFFSNVALNYIDYPTQVIAKSCKPIPVLLMGVLVNRKTYKWSKYACVLLITLGISAFLLKKMPEPSTEKQVFVIGYLCLFASLAMDGFTGPFQERLKHKYKPGPNQLMFFTNIWATFILICALIYTGEWRVASIFCYTYPEILDEILLFSLFSALGQLFIFYTIHTFDALICSIITTTRKFFTFLASVIYFGHPLTIWQWVGVAAVFTGLIWDTLDSRSKRKEE